MRIKNGLTTWNLGLGRWAVIWRWNMSLHEALVAQFFARLVKGHSVQPEGFALAFGMTGFNQMVLGITISVMWPYTKVLHANIMMGEPALAFGGLARRHLNLSVAQA